MMPGIPERRTHSYVRHGTTSLFAALDIATGFVIGKCYKRHRAAEFLNFLKEIDARVPEGLDPLAAGQAVLSAPPYTEIDSAKSRYRTRIIAWRLATQSANKRHRSRMTAQSAGIVN
jgi:hypothetical protein